MITKITRTSEMFDVEHDDRQHHQFAYFPSSGNWVDIEAADYPPSDFKALLDAARENLERNEMEIKKRSDKKCLKM